MFTPTLARTAVAALALVAAGAASAQTRTWSFLDNVNPGACSGNTTSAGGTLSTASGNAWNCTDQATNAPAFNLAITAFSAANVRADSLLATSNNNVGGTSANNFATSTIVLHGGQAPTPVTDNYGLGVGNSITESGSSTTGTNGNHAMDSNDGSTDMLLLSFSTTQVLRSVVMGWSGTDGDFQVLACTTASLCSSAPTIAGRNAASLLSNGWSLVTTVNAPGGGFVPDQSFAVNSGSVSSSYWLISAYNSSFGGTSLGSVGDSLKVMGVTSRPNGVPEPGSLALAGMALLGVFASRRKLS